VSPLRVHVKRAPWPTLSLLQTAPLSAANADSPVVLLSRPVSLRLSREARTEPKADPARNRQATAIEGRSASSRATFFSPARIIRETRSVCQNMNVNRDSRPAVSQNAQNAQTLIVYSTEQSVPLR
jgi:hypothetical protein